MQRHPSIGVLAPLLAGAYFGGILKGVHQQAQAHGFQVVGLQTLGDNIGLVTNQIKHALGWSHIAGWIATVDAVHDEYLHELKRRGKPIVTISKVVPGLECPIVRPDNRGGMLALVRHLLAHGHQRIAFAGRIDQDDTQQRYRAYQEALAEVGIEADPQLLLEASDYNEDGGRTIGRRIVEAGLSCTAIVAATDLNAIGLIEVLQAAGYRVPEDVAVVGFDDLDAAQHLQPPLTTVRQRFDTLGQRAAELLLQLLDDGEAPPGPCYVDVPLILRRSCGCTMVDLQPATSAYPEPRPVHEPHNVSKRLVEAALYPASLGPDQPPERVWPEVPRLVAALEAALAGRHKPVDLAGAWGQMVALNGDLDSVNRVLSTLEQICLERSGAERSARTESSVKNFLRQARLELMRAWQIAERRVIHQLNSMIMRNYQISFEMIQPETESTHNLDWLRWTQSHWGCWTRWAEGAGELEVVAVHAPSGVATPALGSRYQPEAFPPPETWPASVGPGGPDILMLLPIRTAVYDWGVLALAAEPNTLVTYGLGTIGQWAMLLAEALEREQLVNSTRDAYEQMQVLAESVRESEERYALAARGANDGLWDWNLRDNSIYFSPRWKSMLGYAEDEVGTRIDDWLRLVHPDDLVLLNAAIDVHLNQRSSHFEQEYRMLHKDGSYRWILCRGIAVHDEQGVATRMAGSLTDITERKQAEERLIHGAFHDDVTGLPNRALFLDRLGRALEQSTRRPDDLFAVLFLDVDHFKNINDSLGHGIGDELLVALVQRLENCVRSSDTIARLGGDEFALLLANLRSLGDATYIADRIQQELTVPFPLDGREIVISASIGITLSTAEYTRPEHLLRDADTAMYRAKARGRACYEVFDDAMHTRVVRLLQLEADLRRALERGELHLVFQPIVSFQTGAIVGVEALTRWNHPERGPIPPSDFIPIAEEAGLIIPLTEWVLKTACAHGKAWQEEGLRLIVAVNLSPRQFRTRSVTSMVRQVLHESGFAPQHLELELTESSLMEDTEVSLAALQELKAIGVQLAMDDFGTGYSSLAYLKRLPIDILKIDKSFIQDMTGETNDTAIIKAIIDMAHSLKLKVIAEGVETEKQLALLALRRCDEAQGFLLSRPVAAERVTTLLREGWTLDSIIRA